MVNLGRNLLLGNAFVHLISFYLGFIRSDQAEWQNEFLIP